MHEWSSCVSNRTYGNNKGCPVCAGKVPCTCNSLAALHPDLVAAHWDWEANGDLRPEQLRPLSIKKVYRHKGTMTEGWKARPNNVVRSWLATRRRSSESPE